jgi:hypothetical protein
VRILGKGEVPGPVSLQPVHCLCPRWGRRPLTPERDAHGVHGPRRRPGGRGLPRGGRTGRPAPISRIMSSAVRGRSFEGLKQFLR